VPAFRPNRPLSSARLFRAGAAVLALLASTAAPARTEGLLNPAGIVLGGTATFRVDIDPAAFPDAAIHWTAEPASRVSFPSGSSGRTVAVRGEAPGDVALRVAIDGYAGEHPVANARVVPLSTVKADAWIIGDNGVWARTEPEVRKLFDDANDILSQVGVRLSLDSVSFTNHTGWLNFNPSANGWLVPNQIASITNGTGGLVYYFVGNMDNYEGLNSANYILVDRDGSGTTIAHETCHAFGLSDIYTWDGETSLTLSSTMPLRHDRLPMDWGSDSETNGFYPPSLTQSNLIERLLMFGRGKHEALDIPRGDVWGVWYHWTNAPSGGGHVKYWHETNAPVGYFQHANPTPFLK
jgi:hypothetical protein